MPYPRALGGATDSTTLAPILSLSPNPMPAGPGRQLVTVRSTGLQDGDNLTFYPDDYGSVVNPSTQGYGSQLFNISADGTTAQALVDFRGNVTTWEAQVIAPYSNEQSAPFPLQTVPGAVVAAETPTMQSTQPAAPRVTTVLATPIVSSDGPAMVVTNLPGVTTQAKAGGPLTFTPVTALSASQLLALFGDLANDEPTLEVDLFGLPLPSVRQPYPVPYFWPDGSPAYSPWYNAYAARAGTGQVIANTPLPATYQAYYPGAEGATPGASGGGASSSSAPIVTQDADGNPIPPSPIDGGAMAPPVIVGSGEPASGSGPSTALTTTTATVSFTPSLLLVGAVALGVYLMTRGGRR